MHAHTRTHTHTHTHSQITDKSHRKFNMIIAIVQVNNASYSLGNIHKTEF